MERMRVNAGRLEKWIEELSQFGRNRSGGLDRITFSPAEIEARDWLKCQCEALGLTVRTDAAANIWALRAGENRRLPGIAFGSHIDTVPNGGKYDGALGVAIALEVMRVFQENGVLTRHPLELVSFSAEEPNPFGLSTFGSRAVAGKLKRSDLEGRRDGEGRLLTDALHDAGGDPDRFESARREKGELAAYLEVHIEQGARLIRRGVPLGIVQAITGIYREEVTVTGEANHAGTTLMQERKDALTAASELLLSLEEACREHPAEETVGTVGYILNSPNAANIIPGKVQFHFEIRGKSRSDIQDVIDRWNCGVERVRRNRGVTVERRVMLDQHPVQMDQRLVRLLAEQAEKLGYPCHRLGSMAGHDAAHMAALTRSCMLFVPSIGGKSHCPEEESRMEDIEKAANVLLHAVLTLDAQLDREV